MILLMKDFEKLGAFYLGRIFDLENNSLKEDLLLYDSKDMTTHGLCVGMTGSGKTGLCISLLEEAAIDGIPAIVIDPKGDLPNLLLNFPKLRPEDFRPWIDESEAARKGFSTAEYASKTADLWRKGLAKWGEDGSRISKFRDSAEILIYTPGSSAGLPVSALRSFDAPPPQLVQDQDALRDRILGSVSGLLTLLGIDADPIRSREHILLSNILHNAWSRGKSLDIPAIIREIQSPPFNKVGVFDLESFFPGKDRIDLAMSLNNLLASPGFSAWMQGEPMDIGRFLYTPEGRPKISIFSIAHLSDSERMFFVTLLLNEVIAWMRSQEGTSSLRALLYMDEIFGYFPPTAAPPSKKPMLTLLKQARAYGLGVVLATQNPVDLDYKGLSNAGTWFIGRLQTERDKDRVLDGLEGVSRTSGSNFDRKKLSKIISSLGKRVFLMHNVHDNEPVVFHTRWALSYLRGPITRTQIERLMEGAKTSRALKTGVEPISQAGSASVPSAHSVSSGKPFLPPGIPEYFLRGKGSSSESQILQYRPALLGTSRMHFISAKAGLDDWKKLALVTPFPDEGTGAAWEEARAFEDLEREIEKTGLPEARYSPLPPAATKKNSYTVWRKDLAGYLYRNQTIKLWLCPSLKQFSRPGEAEGDFRARLKHLSHEQRDLLMEKLRKRYTPKLARLEERLRKAQVKISREKSQYSHQKMQTVVSIGATVLGALFGRKITSSGNVGRATTTMRGMGRAAREKEDIARAKREAAVVQQKLFDLEEEFKEQTVQIQEDFRPDELEMEEFLVHPRKSDISLSPLAVVWTPWKVDSMGLAEPDF